MQELPLTQIDMSSVENYSKAVEDRATLHANQGLQILASERGFDALFDGEQFGIKVYPTKKYEKPETWEGRTVNVQHEATLIEIEPTDKQKSDPEFARQAANLMGFLEGAIAQQAKLARRGHATTWVKETKANVMTLGGNMLGLLDAIALGSKSVDSAGLGYLIRKENMGAAVV